MSLWRQFATGVRAIAGRRAADRDIADEVGHYLEEAAAARQTQGLSLEEARRAVRLDFGNAVAIQDQIREAGWEAAVVRTIDALSQDMRLGVRAFRRAPFVTLAAIATLAVGIGATTAIFGVANAVLVRPLPYPDPDRLVSLSHAAPGVGMDDIGSAPFLYYTEREAEQTFDSVGLWTIGTASMTGRPQPEQVRRLLVTHEILPMLGVTPLLGRTFSADDDRSDHPPTVILTYGYWRHRFGGDPAVVGQRLMLDDRPRTIIGVLPRSFRFLDLHVDALYPFQLRRADVTVGHYFRSSIARLKPGVTLEAASADVARLIPVALDSFPLRPGTTRTGIERSGFRPNLKPLVAAVVGNVGATLWVLMTTVGIVLLVACANVANLMLVRTDGRHQELATRAALGATSRRLTQELFTESMMLSVAGGAAGTAIAYAILRLVARFASTDLPRVEEVTVDSTVLWFACALTLIAGLLFGTIPAVRYRRSNLDTPRKARGPGRGSPRAPLHARSALVTVQVALALALLIGGGLMLRTVQRLKAVELGFAQPDTLQTVRVDIPGLVTSEPEAVVRLQQQILNRLAKVAGVAAVGYTSHLPMDGGNSVDLLVPEGRVFAPGDRSTLRQFKYISPGLFTSMGTPLITGRDLKWSDVYGARPVALVSDSLARREWGGAARALGKRFRGSSSMDPWREIVGVVGDVREEGVSQPVADLVYMPSLAGRVINTPRFASSSVAYVIRSDRAGTSELLADVQQAVWSVNRDLPVLNSRTMGDVVESSLVRTRFTMLMLLLAGAMAMVLGVTGVYGVVAYAIAQRTREIGVRITMGAPSAEVRRLFVRHGLVVMTVGVAIGLVAAGMLTRWMTMLLLEVRPLDPATYAAVTAVLVLASALAVYVPVRRATRIDPIVALRVE